MQLEKESKPGDILRLYITQEKIYSEREMGFTLNGILYLNNSRGGVNNPFVRSGQFANFCKYFSQLWPQGRSGILSREHISLFRQLWKVIEKSKGPICLGTGLSSVLLETKLRLGRGFQSFIQMQTRNFHPDDNFNSLQSIVHCTFVQHMDIL